MKKINSGVPVVTMLISLLLVGFNLGAFKIIESAASDRARSVMGGILLQEDNIVHMSYTPGNSEQGESYIERYLRPSDNKATEKKYIFSGDGAGLPRVYTFPAEV